MKATCDGCHKTRSGVRTCGHDSNGDADGPDLCFLCRREAQRGKVWDEERGGYVRMVDFAAA